MTKDLQWAKQAAAITRLTTNQIAKRCGVARATIVGYLEGTTTNRVYAKAITASIEEILLEEIKATRIHLKNLEDHLTGNDSQRKTSK